MTTTTTGRGQYPRQINSRYSDEQYDQIQADASAAGMSIGKYIRMRATHQHVSSKQDAQMLRELRRVGGMLKKMWSEGHGTGPALSELMRVLRTMMEGKK